MKKIIAGIILCFGLVGCQSKEICGPTEEVKIEKLIEKPDLELMKKEEPKMTLEKRSAKTTVADVLSHNNLRAVRIERRAEGLQTYVCNIFKENPPEFCK
ncbi:hypothetical protein A54_216 [Septuagintavirus sv54]|uniref:Uncharacterized protein n=1 Tax=Escherichia phage A5-4 TaxID=2996162 RepID=A0AAE9PSN0_9CAUD|nr:hypothetical protein A54_216 [Escherichia phage A5-4]